MKIEYIFIIVFRGGNRRVRSDTPMNAWLAICPNEKDVAFRAVDNRGMKLNVIKDKTQIGRVTKMRRRSGS